MTCLSPFLAPCRTEQPSSVCFIKQEFVSMVLLQSIIVSKARIYASPCVYKYKNDKNY